MRQIPLTQGKAALVDDDDYERLAIRRWRVSGGYAMRRICVDGNKQAVFMHREILEHAFGQFPDSHDSHHIDGNRLNNTKANLQILPHWEHIANHRLQEERPSSSGMRGVYRHKNRWKAQIKVRGRNVYLGLFADRAEAERAYISARAVYFGRGNAC